MALPILKTEIPSLELEEVNITYHKMCDMEVSICKKKMRCCKSNNLSNVSQIQMLGHNNLTYYHITSNLNVFQNALLSKPEAS